MLKITGFGLLVAGLALIAASDARAQTGAPDRFFFDVSAGAQSGFPALKRTATATLDGQPAAEAITQPRPSGPLVDVRGGYRIGRHLGIALAVTGFRRDSTGEATVGVPGAPEGATPLFADFQVTGFRGEEIGYHLQAVWFVPITSRLDVSLAVGPSLVHVAQQVLALEVAPDTQAISLRSPREKGTAAGANGRIDVAFWFSRRYGVGAFAQYVSARVNLASVSRLKVGGAQGGGGIRVRF